MPCRADIGSVDITIVDAEIKHQRDFGDEKKTEEESETAQRFLAAFLERDVIDLINTGPQHIESRHYRD